MHNAIRMAQATQRTLFERLRSGRLLRGVSVIMALVAFQNSFTCMCDSPSQATKGGIAATQAAIILDGGVVSENPDDDCCAHLRITLATSAMVVWTPPTLLRPPIRIV
jgi:hypothetical protein